MVTLVKSIILRIAYAAFLAIFLSAYGYKKDQGFAVDAGSKVVLSINSSIVSSDQLADRFIKKRVGELDYYLAVPNAFNGSEVIIVNAYAVDAAGNESRYPSTMKIEPINTSTTLPPLVKSIASDVSEKYSRGFSVSAGARPKVYINDVEIAGDNLFDWFDRYNKGQFDEYIAKGGLFEGDETLVVSADAIDEWGNKSDFSKPIRLPAIDTVAPASPTIKTLSNVSDLSPHSQISHRDSDQVKPTRVMSLKDLPSISQSTHSSGPDSAKKYKEPVGNSIDYVDTDIDIDRDRDEDLDNYISEILSDSSVRGEILTKPNEYGLKVEERLKRREKVAGTGLTLSSTRYNEADPQQTCENNPLPAKQVPRPTNIKANCRPEVIDRNDPPDKVQWDKGYKSAYGENSQNGVAKPHPKKEFLVDVDVGSESARAPVFRLENDSDNQAFIDWLSQYLDYPQCHSDASLNIDSNQVEHCLRLAGFPDAKIESYGMDLVVEPGARVFIDSIDFSKSFIGDMKPASSFIADLEKRPFNIDSHAKALKRLESLGMISQPSFNYFAVDDDSYVAELIGEPNASSIGTGVSYGGDGKLRGIVRGVHRFELFGFRYLDYQLGSDSQGNFDFALEAPLFYRIDDQINVSVYSSPMDFPYFKYRHSGVDFGWHHYNADLFGRKNNYTFSIGGFQSNDLQYFAAIKDKPISQDPHDTYQLSWQLHGLSILREGDVYDASVTVNVIDDDRYSDSFNKFHFNYFSGNIAVSSALNLSAKFSYDFIDGDIANIPVEARLYLGGVHTIRGVRSRYLGSSSAAQESGGKKSFSAQFEVSKGLNIFDRKVVFGVHYDVGATSSELLNSNVSAYSYGIFAKANLGRSTEGYAFFSDANVESAGKAPLGLAIVQRL